MPLKQLVSLKTIRKTFINRILKSRCQNLSYNIGIDYNQTSLRDMII